MTLGYQVVMTSLSYFIMLTLNLENIKSMLKLAVALTYE